MIIWYRQNWYVNRKINESEMYHVMVNKDNVKYRNFRQWETLENIEI